MQNTNDFIMYFSLLGLYIRDRESSTLDRVPRMVLEHYLFDTLAEFIGKTCNISEEEMIEISKQKVKSGEISTFLLEYGESLIDKYKT